MNEGTRERKKTNPTSIVEPAAKLYEYDERFLTGFEVTNSMSCYDKQHVYRKIFAIFVSYF